MTRLLLVCGLALVGCTGSAHSAATAGSTTAGSTTSGTTTGATTAGGTTSSTTDAQPCPHDDCAVGAALASSCDACATQICASDSYCCTTKWSSLCVNEVGSICGLSCSGGTTTGTTGTTGSTDMGSAPRNSSCTPLSQQTGKIVNTSHGRLDGTLVYVLPLDGSSQCNGDNAHVHLQVSASGNVYDVAVDVGASGDEVGLYQATETVPGGVWSEGWHDGSLSYSSLSLHSTSFPLQDPATIASEVESLLSSVTTISIFCTGYTPGDNGCHDVHYENGSSTDGAIVLNPTSATSQMLFFRFSDQSF